MQQGMDAPQLPVRSSLCVREPWLVAACCVAEGAAPAAVGAGADADAEPPCAARVRAVLFDACQRLLALGGRPGLSRSTGSVYTAAVARFLGNGLPCRTLRVRFEDDDDAGRIATPRDVAVTVDGKAVVALFERGVVAFDVATGRILKRHPSSNRGRAGSLFAHPGNVCVAPTGTIFVADEGVDMTAYTPAFEVDYVERFANPVCHVSADAHVVAVVAGTCVEVFRDRQPVKQLDTAFELSSVNAGWTRTVTVVPGADALALVHGDRAAGPPRLSMNRPLELYVSVVTFTGAVVRRLALRTTSRPRLLAFASGGECVAVFDDVVKVVFAHGREPSDVPCVLHGVERSDFVCKPALCSDALVTVCFATTPHAAVDVEVVEVKDEAEAEDEAEDDDEASDVGTEISEHDAGSVGAEDVEDVGSFTEEEEGEREAVPSDEPLQEAEAEASAETETAETETVIEVVREAETQVVHDAETEAAEVVDDDTVAAEVVHDAETEAAEVVDDDTVAAEVVHDAETEAAEVVDDDTVAAEVVHDAETEAAEAMDETVADAETKTSEDEVSEPAAQPQAEEDGPGERNSEVSEISNVSNVSDASSATSSASSRSARRQRRWCTIC
jgi:hypothetical protein